MRFRIARLHKHIYNNLAYFAVGGELLAGERIEHDEVVVRQAAHVRGRDIKAAVCGRRVAARAARRRGRGQAGIKRARGAALLIKTKNKLWKLRRQVSTMTLGINIE